MSSRKASVGLAMLMLAFTVPAHALDRGTGRTAPDCLAWKMIPAATLQNTILVSAGASSSHDVWTVGLRFGTSGIPPILHWDGGSWSQPAEPQISGSLYDVSVLGPSDAWAAGATRNGIPLVEHWDGSAWRLASTAGLVVQVSAIEAISDTDVWALSGGAMNHWDGKRWTETAIFGGLPIRLAGVSSNDVWVVGYSAYLPQAEHWDGVEWSVVQVPAPPDTPSRLSDVVAISSDDVWAVGYYGATQPLLDHWNGTAWTEVPGPDVSGLSLTGVSATSSSDVWAVGGGRHISLHWDGTTWTPEPYAGATTVSLFAVAAVSPVDIWGVGDRVSQASATSVVEFSNGPCA